MVTRPLPVGNLTNSESFAIHVSHFNKVQAVNFVINSSSDHTNYMNYITTCVQHIWRVMVCGVTMYGRNIPFATWEAIYTFKHWQTPWKHETQSRCDA